jgi:hypothetical protein
MVGFGPFLGYFLSTSRKGLPHPRLHGDLLAEVLKSILPSHISLSAFRAPDRSLLQRDFSMTHDAEDHILCLSFCLSSNSDRFYR